MSFANMDGLAGPTNDSASNTALFPLGTPTVMGSTSYVYAQAATAQAAAAQHALTGAFATTTGTTRTHDVSGVGVLINQYFWSKLIASVL